MLSPLIWVANENYVCGGHDFGDWFNVDCWMLVVVGHYGGLVRTTLKREKLRTVRYGYKRTYRGIADAVLP